MTELSAYGLVLCGGRSTRMGRDKAFIDYHGKPQVYQVHELLAGFFKEVIISCRGEQYELLDKNFRLLADDKIYADSGPISGLLTASDLLPEKSAMVMGTDYPFMNKMELAEFIRTIRPDTFAASFYNREEDLFEPLLAYYSSAACRELKQFYRDGCDSLQQFLRKHDASRYYPLDITVIKSIDTPNQEADALRILTGNHFL